MQFLMMTTGDTSTTGNPPTPEVYAEMDKLIEEMSKAGVLLASGGFDPQHATRVKSSGGKITVTDGPFAEAKEGIVGFALIKARSKEEALEYSMRFWQVGGDGEGNIYQVFDPGDQPPGQ